MLNLYKIRNLWSTIKIALFLLFTNYSLACDVCGCAVGGMSMGLGMETTSNFVGLRYSHVLFNAQINYNSQYLENVYSNDRYNRIELTGKYHFTPRFYAMIALPYVYNRMQGNTEDITNSSFGDATLNLAYRLISPPMDTSKTRGVLLDLGGGISAPTGNYQQYHEGNIVNRNFQAGKGSFAYTVALKFMYMHKKWRYLLDASYTMNTENNLGYRFGNQTNVVVGVGRMFAWKNLSLFPSMGVYAEHGDRHTEDGKYQFNTGGDAVLADLGLAIKSKSFTYWLKFLPVITQSYNVDQISSIQGGNRFNVGVRYRF